MFQQAESFKVPEEAQLSALKFSISDVDNKLLLAPYSDYSTSRPYQNPGTFERDGSINFVQDDWSYIKHNLEQIDPILRDGVLEQYDRTVTAFIFDRPISQGFGAEAIVNADKRLQDLDARQLALIKPAWDALGKGVQSEFRSDYRDRQNGGPTLALMFGTRFFEQFENLVRERQAITRAIAAEHR